MFTIFSMRTIFLLLFATLPLAAGAPTTSPSDAPPTYLCHRAKSAITIDGKLDDRAWDAAPWTSDFVSLLPDQPEPNLRTRCKLLYDDKNLYIAAELTEPNLFATDIKMMLFTENNFEVFLDPNANGTNYWELEINPKNALWILLLPRPYRAGGKANMNAKMPGIKSAVHLNGTLNNPSDKDQSWTVEIAIPFSAFIGTNKVSLPPKAKDHWRINLARAEQTLEVIDNEYKQDKSTPTEYTAWACPGEENLHTPNQWGHLIFEAD